MGIRWLILIIFNLSPGMMSLLIDAATTSQVVGPFLIMRYASVVMKCTSSGSPLERGGRGVMLRALTKFKIPFKEAMNYA